MFLAPEPEDDPRQPSRVLQRRGHKLDIDALPTVARKAFAGRRREAITRFDVTPGEAFAARSRKPKRRDPNILG